jgi:tetratricopeptide (TPR) repeat protein
MAIRIGGAGWSAAAIVVALGGCQPRMPVAPAPLPEPVVFAPPEEAGAGVERARRAFEEGVLLGRQSRWSEAADRYRLAAEADPAEARYPMALSDALVAQGLHSAAADALSAALRIEEAAPRPSHRVLYVDYERLVRLLTRADRLDEARAARERQEYHRRMRDAL